ncbi:VOC family protein [Aliiglaciecola sp. CAU 1673]|uniref:VOC family protein n=1 Tax=Aliiglaciecola sp. CAU 1673 TaxID=3032595 RepID=UPI0023DA8872|nr:VOC family protein [Aliiglaciecola sp. CAU 1673]MDF2179766.1 VOC family protein [Aliiglaciecola sp. CAU 1673]
MQSQLTRALVIATMICGLPAMPNSLAEQTSNKGAPIQLSGMKTRIETPFFEESLAFYTDYIGLSVLESWDEKGDRGVILGISKTPQAEAFLEIAATPSVPIYQGLSLQFRSKDLQGFVEKFANTISFTGPTKRPWGSTYLYLTDPSGIRVILYEGDL